MRGGRGEGTASFGCAFMRDFKCLVGPEEKVRGMGIGAPIASQKKTRTKGSDGKLFPLTQVPLRLEGGRVCCVCLS